MSTKDIHEHHEPAPPLGLGSSEGLGALVEKLRSVASAGYDEWRVQNPDGGSFCIAYSWPDSHYPEREAVAWLADHKRRFPDSQFAGYVVACVRVVPTKDRLLKEAADELEKLHAALASADILAEHSGSKESREWHSVGCWLRPGEVLAHMDRVAPNVELSGGASQPSARTQGSAS